MEIFDIGPPAAFAALTSIGVVTIAAAVYFFYSAPPTIITISTGPEGSIFQNYAKRYAKILEQSGVTVKILTSKGSLENLQRLADRRSGVQVGIAQGGLKAPGTEQLVSLGSIAYQPLLIFHHGKAIEFLSQLSGKRLAIGPEGSGVRSFALAILKANGITEGGSTTLLDYEGEEAAKALTEERIDAAFVMNESTSGKILHSLLHSGDIRLFSFRQASAYHRRIDYLNILDLPEGSIDLGKNIPSQDIRLMGPMVELVAVKGLHPALSDLLLDAATQVHSRPGMFQKRGEFPTPVEQAIRISDDASRFYKSGKSLLYRYLPFWLASVLSRIVVVVIPMLVVMIPTLKTIPAVFKWRIQKRLHRRYRELLTLERALVTEKDLAKQELLRRRFDAIEESVYKMKVPASFLDQFYGLRGHIDYVRTLIERKRK